MLTRLAALLLVLAGLAALAGIGWQDVKQFATEFGDEAKTQTRNVQNTGEDLLFPQKDIAAPGPLRGSLQGQASQLTVQGVLANTNEERTSRGGQALELNETLSRAARNKLDDMFAKQYFAHQSPTGKGPADVVDDVRYNYVRVGENLALGNFGSDDALVQAWMNSPGHRANILSGGFQEIGIAVGQGTFQGQQTWLAVQTFATPASACPNPATALRDEIDAKKVELGTLQENVVEQNTQLEEAQAELENLIAQANALAEEGRTKVEEGNEQIRKGNEIYEETGDEEQARPHWERGEELQKEGQALLQDAEEKQLAAQRKQGEVDELRSQYNATVGQYNTLRDEIISLTDRYNARVREYNACVQQLANS